MRHSFIYNKETHTATYTIYARDREFIGTAICAEQDYDFETERVGRQLAMTRAAIKELQDYRRLLKAKLTALQHLYGSYTSQKKVNMDSAEVKLLRRQIGDTQHEIADMAEMIEEHKKVVRFIISSKDNMYKFIRKHRDNDQNLST